MGVLDIQEHNFLLKDLQKIPKDLENIIKHNIYLEFVDQHKHQVIGILLNKHEYHYLRMYHAHHYFMGIEIHITYYHNR